MNNAKRMTLQEIEAMPKASVIWFELHSLDDSDTFAEYYNIYPAMIAAPGENGVICWGSSDEYGVLEINNELINNDRLFWDHEPDKDMIFRGIPADIYNNMHIYPESETAKRLMTAITSRGYEINRFYSLSGVDESEFMQIIQGEREPDLSEIQQISGTLHLDEAEMRSIFYANVFDIKTGKRID